MLVVRLEGTAYATSVQKWSEWMILQLSSESRHQYRTLMLVI